MKRKIPFTFVLVILIVLLAVSCGGTIAPAVTEKSNTTATVYIIQPSSTVTFTGFGSLTAGSKFQVWDNDTWLGLIGSKSYIVYYASPGTHYFMLRGENWDIVRANLRAGRTYYLKTTDTPGFTGARVVVEPVDPKNPDLQKWLDDSKQIKPTQKASEALKKDATTALENAKTGKASVKDMPSGWGI
jgi:hypothetical protein